IMQIDASGNYRDILKIELLSKEVGIPLRHSDDPIESGQRSAFEFKHLPVLNLPDTSHQWWRSNLRLSLIDFRLDVVSEQERRYFDPIGCEDRGVGEIENDEVVILIELSLDKRASFFGAISSH